jgi:hypothetical protein
MGRGWLQCGERDVKAMRVVELSDHPGDMLQQARQRRKAEAEQDRQRYEAEYARHRERMDGAVAARGQAWVARRWGTWLRAVLTVWRERRQAPVAPGPSRLPAAEEQALEAGVAGEQLAEAGLGRALGDEWTLLRGYRNRRGEIDHLLLGPGGLFAIEGKHRNAMVHCEGDRWWFTKYDRYGNPVDRGEMADRGGRSPSEQLNEPASQLEEFLRSRGHPVAVQRVVLLTHPRSRVGSCVRPTVRITTSTDQIVDLVRGSPLVIAADEQAQLERLVIRDHRYHQKPRSPGTKLRRS